MGFWSKVGNAISSAASTVAAAVEATVDVVTDTLEDAVDTAIDAAEGVVDEAVDAACDHGDVLCGAAKVVGGVVNGGLDAARELTHDATALFPDAVHVGTEILRGDLPGAVDALGSFAIDSVDLGVDGTRFALGGFFVGGAIREFDRRSLREFVEELLANTFSGARLAAARAAVGLDGGDFGLPLDAFHLRFYLDSKSVPLWSWHEEGFIDLYGLAGLFSTDSFGVLPNARTVVKSVTPDGTNRIMPINRWQLSTYIESQGREGRIRVYAMSDAAVAEKLDAAAEKLRDIGIVLSWNVPRRFSWPSSYERGDWEIKSKAEYVFPLPKNKNAGELGLARYVRVSRLRSGKPEEECEPLALGAFRYGREGGKERFGLTEGRGELADPTRCPTPGRTDGCCMVVMPAVDRDGEPVGSAVIHRDVWPYDVMRFVLVHELGHYLGLCHLCHDPSNVMYTVEPGSGAHFFDRGLLGYYWHDDPIFTLEDGKNAWRFIVSQMQGCLSL